MKESVEVLDSNSLTKKFVRIGAIVKLASIAVVFIAMYAMSL